ncbi:transcription elongation factor GreA [[Collinsella] massiliensis]|uniref:Transcription elongation factor GreA n=1 Tax=[Collinsella] massiliensis TaxID=1232426 RepID=A0A1Y3XWA8_9ACTN|nr:transcription elongation factor GreA [[Collinsella] massiliensis]OUN89795.1 transcription elongation factor GreA [[Collinsella] massiliensis]
METPEFVLTSEGRQKLVDELAWREGDLTKEIVERIKTARDFGDLSENSEYDDAREEQAKNAARIAEIRAILANAKEAEDTGHTFTVSLGCVVELVDENGEVSEVTIVGSTETDSLRHRISNESPIGRAIINHAEGETVEVQLPSGKTRTYTITKISR